MKEMRKRDFANRTISLRRVSTKGLVINFIMISAFKDTIRKI